MLITGMDLLLPFGHYAIFALHNKLPMKQFVFSFLLFLAASFAAQAQTDYQNTGWFMFVNSTKINKKWATHLDFQYRSSDDWKHKKNLMFRPGITYLINNKQEVTLGYLLNESYTYADATPDFHVSEHRIWEQYIYKHKLSSIAATHRFRLEQRFVGKHNAEDVFAQRFRYFFRFLIPLEKQAASFEKGVFVALQNEVFLNIDNKEVINNSLFDQNRAYGAIGYRLNKKLDIETGYMNQAVKGAVGHTSNNIIQLAVYTRF